MGLTHIWRMRVLLQLILPLLVQGKSIVKERNGVIKQALIPTLVNIIGHARMQEHGTDIDNLLNYMDEEKIKFKMQRNMMNLMMSPNLMRKFWSLRFWKRKRAWKKQSKIWRKKRITKRYHKKTMRKLSKKKSLRRRRVWRRT